MTLYRYSVCKFDSQVFTEFISMTNKSKKELLLYLNIYTSVGLCASGNERFRDLDDAMSFATGVYVKNNSGDLIAIFDVTERTWIDCWFI